MKVDYGNKKVLVCSINAWNDKVGDNTFSLLLQNYPKDNIASLFIREDNPNSPNCDKYFRISENKVFKSILKRRIKTGEKINLDEKCENTEFDKHKKIYSNKKRFYYFKLFIREIIWKLGKWKTKELNDFIDSFAPDIILYEMSRYIHLNRIVKYILKRTNAKGVGCFWDDTFTYKQGKNFGYKFLRFFQRKNLKKLTKSTHDFFAITPKTKREADDFFKIESVVLTKPILKDNRLEKQEITFPLKMLYTGNLSIGREDTMLSIVEALNHVNKDEKMLTLDIYTNSILADNYKKAFQTNFSNLHPPVTQKEVLELQKQSDILLFVESLSDKNKVARLSFSTKIVDYYSSGKCIFAIGNKDLAPIELFIEDDTAIVAVTEDEVDLKIKELLNIDLVKEYSKKSYNIGAEKYSLERVQNIFFEVLLRDRR